MENEKYEKASKSLRFFRHSDYDIEVEIHEIQQKHFEKKAQINQTWNWIWSRLCSRSFLKPFCCIGVLASLTNVSGFSILSNYLTEFLDESGSDIDPFVGPMAIGIIRMIVVGKLL